jgi:glycosyltransferase involved in cell wall biosynthesis
VIGATIRSLLNCDYENFEIVVVDDGSVDRTSEVVREQFADEARVRLFTEPNAGKAEALNHGLRQSKGEIIVALDADTQFPAGRSVQHPRRKRLPRRGTTGSKPRAKAISGRN